MAITPALKHYRSEEITIDAVHWKLNNNNGFSPLIQATSVTTPCLDAIFSMTLVTTGYYGKWTQRGKEWCSLTLLLTTSTLLTLSMKDVSKKTCIHQCYLLWLNMVHFLQIAKYGSLTSIAFRNTFNAYDRSYLHTFTPRRILQTRT